MLTPNEILRRLLENEVECVLVGGLAAIAYGVSTMTQDVDVCFSFHEENITKLLKALDGIHSRARAGSGVIPIEQFGISRLAQLDNLYLRTDVGELDLLGQIAGLGKYEQVVKYSTEIEIFGLRCRILNLDALIAIKEALGRPKDHHVALELKAIREKLKT